MNEVQKHQFFFVYIILLFSQDKGLDLGPPHNTQLIAQNEWKAFKSKDPHFILPRISRLLPKNYEFTVIAKLASVAQINILFVEKIKSFLIYRTCFMNIFDIFSYITLHILPKNKKSKIMSKIYLIL